MLQNCRIIHPSLPPPRSVRQKKRKGCWPACQLWSRLYWRGLLLFRYPITIIIPRFFFLRFFIRLSLYPNTLNLYVQNGHLASFLMIKSVCPLASPSCVFDTTNQSANNPWNQRTESTKQPTNPPNNSSICLWLEMIGPPQNKSSNAMYMRMHIISYIYMYHNLYK